MTASNHETSCREYSKMVKVISSAHYCFLGLSTPFSIVTGLKGELLTLNPLSDMTYVTHDLRENLGEDVCVI